MCMIGFFRQPILKFMYIPLKCSLTLVLILSEGKIVFLICAYNYVEHTRWRYIYLYLELLCYYTYTGCSTTVPNYTFYNVHFKSFSIGEMSQRNSDV